MAEERRRDADVMQDSGPGQLFMPFLVMEDLLDKLKLLQGSNDITNELKIKPLNRHYFILSSSPGEQFFTFVNLATWLIRKSGHKMDTPQEMDDPNSTIHNILEMLRKMNVAITFPPSRLKPGLGSEVLFVLDRLADQALKAANFSWKKPVYPQDEEEEEGNVDGESEIILEKLDEEIEEAEDDDDDDDSVEAFLNYENLNKSRSSTKFDMYQDLIKQDDILECNTDSTEWKLEVERVLPQLKVTIHLDNKDWRSHVDQMHTHKKEIDESLTVTHTQLDKLNSEMSRALEKISSREKYLNQQLETLLMEYRNNQEQLSHAKEKYRSVSGGVIDRSRTLAQISDELEQIKQEMDEKGSSMTDGTPLVNIRKSLTNLRAEIVQMNIRIGVGTHTLLQAKLKEKGSLQQASNAVSSNTTIESVF